MKKRRKFEVIKEGTGQKKGHKLLCGDESAIKKHIEGGFWKELKEEK